MITELQKQTETLLMHAKVITEARNRLFWHWFKGWSTVFGLIFAFVMMVLMIGSRQLILHSLDIPHNSGIFTADPSTFGGMQIVLLLFSVVTLFIGIFFVPRSVRAKEKELTSKLNRVFEDVYAHDLMNSNQSDFLKTMWEGIHPISKTVLEKFSLFSFPSLKKRQIQQMERVLSKEVQEMLDEVHKNLKAYV